MTIKAVFKSGDRTYRMKIKETLKNGDVILIDGSTIEKKDILEIIKEK